MTMSALVTDKVYQPTDLRRDRDFIDAARAGCARLRDTDGASYILLPEMRVGCMQTELATLRQLMDITRAVFVITDAWKHNHDVRAVIGGGPWPWLVDFDDDDLHEFLHDTVHAVMQGIVDKESAAAERVIESWRESARALADPDRLAALTAPIVMDDFEEIHPE